MTNLEKYFGTPELAAESVGRLVWYYRLIVDGVCNLLGDCGVCPCSVVTDGLYACKEITVSELAEWLGEEAVDRR